jgi:hypothetical protein
MGSQHLQVQTILGCRHDALVEVVIVAVEPDESGFLPGVLGEVAKGSTQDDGRVSAIHIPASLDRSTSRRPYP